MRLNTLSALALGGLTLSLSACTMNSRANLGLSGSSSNLIARITPDKGEGRTYNVGEAVKINVTTRDDGYVTLFALDQDGSANVLLRNAYVKAGTTTFPRTEDGVTFNAALPANYKCANNVCLQRIRAIFVRPRPTTDLVLGGVYDGTRLNDATTQYLNPYALPDRDIQETYIYIK